MLGCCVVLNYIVFWRSAIVLVPNKRPGMSTCNVARLPWYLAQGRLKLGCVALMKGQIVPSVVMESHDSHISMNLNIEDGFQFLTYKDSSTTRTSWPCNLHFLQVMCDLGLAGQFADKLTVSQVTDWSTRRQRVFLNHEKTTLYLYTKLQRVDQSTTWLTASWFVQQIVLLPFGVGEGVKMWVSPFQYGSLTHSVTWPA